MGACYVLPQGVLAIVLLMGSVFGETRAALDVGWGSLFALCLSQPCWGQGLLPSCWSKKPQIWL